MSKDEHPQDGNKGWLNPLAGDIGPVRRVWRLCLVLVLLYFLAAPFIMFYNYRRVFPPSFDLTPALTEGAQTPADGVLFTDTLIRLTRQMVQAWLPNDLIYPTVLMDNPQNFQLGQLEVLRYSTRVLRDKLSRQRTTDKIDPHADRAFTDFSNNPRLWVFPSYESKLKDGIKALTSYRKGLDDGVSHFYPRADNLIELLDQLTSLLGGENTRLANAPRDREERLSVETAGDQYTSGEKLKRTRVPWLEIDDNFYHARGVAYALRQVLMAVRWEFREILKIKRSQELMDTVLEDLALADFEPMMVLNGDRDSVFANHSLKLMATLEEVRQKLINLQAMLER